MHIRKLVSGRYQCMIRLQGVSTSKTFPNKQSAKIWGQEQELSIFGSFNFSLTNFGTSSSS